MEQKLQNLIMLLERMQVLYARVLEILEREKQALIELNFESILSCMREKDEIVSVIKSLDADRLRIQDQFALIMNTSSDTVTVGYLISQLKEQAPLETKRLSQVREDVALAINLVKRKVDNNRVFIEASIENLKKIASALGDAQRGNFSSQKSPAAGVYTGKGKVKKPEHSKGSLVEKRL